MNVWARCRCHLLACLRVTKRNQIQDTRYVRMFLVKRRTLSHHLLLSLWWRSCSPSSSSSSSSSPPSHSLLLGWRMTDAVITPGSQTDPLLTGGGKRNVTQPAVSGFSCTDYISYGSEGLRAAMGRESLSPSLSVCVCVCVYACVCVSVGVCGCRR